MEMDTWKVSIENRLAKIETTNAVDAERHTQVTKRLDAIDGHLGWIFKLLVGGIVGALLTFIIGGGLVL